MYVGISCVLISVYPIAVYLISIYRCLCVEMNDVFMQCLTVNCAVLLVERRHGKGSVCGGET